jgi:LacI family transcriptional regulator
MSTPVRRKRPTQADVARRAGLSQAMVSYVLNANTAVSVPEETRARVLAAMRELGYVPNRTARSLRTSKTLTIASIIPDIANPFYPAFVRGVQDMADHHGYDLIMYNSDGAAEKERKYLQSVEQGRVDGLVGVFFHVTARDLAGLLEQGIAVVRLEAMRKSAGELPLDNIFVDSLAAAHEAIDFLLGRGYRRIAMLGNTPGPGEARQQGYRRALQAASMPLREEFILHCDFTEAGGYLGMQTLLALPVRPDAVFAANDVMAMGALAAIQAAGLHVPDDVAVMGFDDIPLARQLSPPLTTVRQFQTQLGRRAAELLLERLTGHYAGPGRSQEMPHEIVVRASA